MNDPRSDEFKHPEGNEDAQPLRRELGPFVVREEIGLPGDKPYWVAIDPKTGICIRGHNSREVAAEDAVALNAAYRLGRDVASHPEYVAKASFWPHATYHYDDHTTDWVIRVHHAAGFDSIGAANSEREAKCICDSLNDEASARRLAELVDRRLR